ncbi:MAG TPA: hypothetical protein DCQ63_07145, partial [Planktothrix sp. UBA8402]|nr:hypothetical protein [Planktothrix sp. UBA8402]
MGRSKNFTKFRQYGVIVTSTLLLFISLSPRLLAQGEGINIPPQVPQPDPNRDRFLPRPPIPPKPEPPPNPELTPTP